jgi:hypothetical protein
MATSRPYIISACCDDVMQQYRPSYRLKVRLIMFEIYSVNVILLLMFTVLSFIVFVCAVQGSVGPVTFASCLAGR